MTKSVQTKQTVCMHKFLDNKMNIMIENQ
jgi:hypothetical protein